MIPLLVALGIGGLLLVAFWDEIVDWLKKLVAGLRHMFSELKKKIAHAAGAFIEREERGLAAIRHKLYYQEQGEGRKLFTRLKSRNHPRLQPSRRYAKFLQAIRIRKV